MINNLKICSLFSGIGGFELAFESLGCETVFANDNDKFACQTYRTNFSSKILFEGDVRKLEERDIPSHDILVAGFPCQPFSLAQSGKKGLEHSSGDLFQEIVRVLKYHRPLFFLLENVKGLTFKNNKEIFDNILNSLKDLGYFVRWEILSPHTHANIPQSRGRIFLVGFLNQEQSEKFEFPKPIALTAKLSDFIDFDDMKHEKYYYDSKKHKYYDLLKEKIVEVEKEKGKTTFQWRRSYVKVNKSNNSFALCSYLPWTPIVMSDENQKKTDNVPMVYQFRRNYVREAKENICPTLTSNMGSGGQNVPIINSKYTISEKGWEGMKRRKEQGSGENHSFQLLNSNSEKVNTLTARYYKEGEQLVEQKENRPRKLTPRECANLMGFPRNFKIVVSDTQAYRQFGNSVVVPLIKLIAQKLLKVIH